MTEYFRQNGKTRLFYCIVLFGCMSESRRSESRKVGMSKLETTNFNDVLGQWLCYCPEGNSLDCPWKVFQNIKCNHNHIFFVRLVNKATSDKELRSRHMQCRHKQNNTTQQHNTKVHPFLPSSLHTPQKRNVQGGGRKGGGNQFFPGHFGQVRISANCSA